MALASIINELSLPYTPEQVWGALTDPAALARWLMPNDFQARVGHRFTFRTAPAPPYFDGIVHCEVVEVEPPTSLAYTWVGGPLLDTLVRFTLHPEGGGTRLRLEHSGFDAENPAVRVTMAALSGGWRSPELAARIGAAIDAAR